MKSCKCLYVPKGKTLRFRSLHCETVIVHGTLEIDETLYARHIQGKGVLIAGEVNAEDIHIRVLRAEIVTVSNILANQLACTDLRAGHAEVLLYLEACHAVCSRLTVYASRIEEAEIEELIRLQKRPKSMLGMLFASWLRSLLLSLITWDRRRNKKTHTVSKEPAGQAKTEEPENIRASVLLLEQSGYHIRREEEAA